MDRDDRFRRIRLAVTAPQAAGVAGLIAAGLLVVAFVLMRRGLGGPPSLEALTAGTNDVDQAQLRAGLTLVPYVAVTFIWFMAVVRLQFAAPDDTFFGTVFLANGVLLLGCLLVSTALAGGALDLRDIQLEGRGAALWLGGAGIYDLLFGIAPRLAGAFVLITSNLLRRVGLTPVWFSWSSVLIGIVLLFGVRRVDWVVYLFPVWVAAVSLLIVVRERGVVRANGTT